MKKWNIYFGVFGFSLFYWWDIPYKKVSLPLNNSKWRFLSFLKMNPSCIFSPILDIIMQMGIVIICQFWFSSQNFLLNVCLFAGIFAYLNYHVPRTRREILETLIKGLQRLEYRGYDSAGISFINNMSVAWFLNLNRKACLFILITVLLLMSIFFC